MRCSKAIAVCLLLCALAMRAVAHAEPDRLEAVSGLLAQGRTDEAYIELEAFARLPSAPARVFVYKGVIERNRHLNRLAIASFQAGLAHYPDDTSLRLELAVTYSWESRLHEALAEYDRVLAHAPEQESALLGRARILGWLGRRAESLAEFEKFLASHPNDVEALRGLGDVLRADLQPTRARAAYSRVLVVAPNDAQALAGLRALDEATRAEANLSLGASRLSSGSVQPVASARLTYQLRPTFGLFLGSRSDAGVLAPASGALVRPSRWLHVLEAGVSLRPSERVGTVVGYRTTIVPSQTLHGLFSDVSFRAARWLTLVAGAAPSISSHGRLGLLVQGGPQWLGKGDTYLMAQVFRYDDTSPFHATSCAASGRLDLGARWFLKAGLSRTWTAAGNGGLLYAELGVAASRSSALTVHYEHATGLVARDMASLGFQVRF